MQYTVYRTNPYGLYATVNGPVELSSLIYHLPSFSNWQPSAADLADIYVSGQGATLNSPVNWGTYGGYFNTAGLGVVGNGELTVNADFSRLAFGALQANDNSTLNLGPNATGTPGINAEGKSTINMYGGDVQRIFGYGIQSLSSQPTPDSTINIYGGTISEEVTIIESDTLNIYGGSGTYGISASEDHGGDPQVNVYGTNLQVVDLNYYGHYEPAIVGTLADGTVLSGVNGGAWNGSNGIEFGGDLNNLHFFAPNAAPEPSPFVALGVGTLGLALRRRKR